jgi:hypothetical protein
MRRKLAVLMISATCMVLGTGQLTTEQINTSNACSYSGATSPTKVMAFASDSEAEQVVGRIVGALGLTQNFAIRAAGIPNAAATLDLATKKRYLLYSQTFIQDMRRATGSQWAAMSVMAHEIAHHLNNHTLEPNRDPRFEIEADYTSGFVLQRLGATLAEAQSAINYLPISTASSTHPAKHDRLAAIANGWTKSCNDTGCNRPKADAKAEVKEDTRDDRYTPPSKPRRTGPDSCDYAKDGTCDEPDLCDRGTDTTDCKAVKTNPRSTPLYCCDGFGRRWCPIVVNPGPPGTPCFCNGIPGSGFICQ